MGAVTPMELKVIKHTIDYSDLGDTDTSQTLGMYLPGKGGFLIDVIIYISTAFSGSGVVGPTVKLGTADDTEILYQKQSIAQAGYLIRHPTRKGRYCDGMLKRAGAARELDYQVVFETQSGNLSSITAGVAEFIVFYAV